MWYVFGTLAVVLVLYVLWRLMGARYLTFPPVAIDDKDPLMLEAYQKARASVDRLRHRFAECPLACTVKVPFQTDKGTIEHLWGEVRDLTAESVRVALVNRPVTQKGPLPSEVEVPLAQISDWQVLNSDDTISGAFTTHVMFIRAKEQWGVLPPKLAEQQKRFLDA